MNIYIQCVNVLNIAVPRKNKVKHGKAKHKVPKNAKENYARYSLDSNNDIVKNGGFKAKLRKFASIKETTTLYNTFEVDNDANFIEVLNKVLPQLFAMQGKAIREGEMRKIFTIQFGETNANEVDDFGQAIGEVKQPRLCILERLTITFQGGKYYLDKNAYQRLKTAFLGEAYVPQRLDIVVPTYERK